MSDSKIIMDTISVIITNDHPILYQYIKGRGTSHTAAIIRLTHLIAPIFIGAYDDKMVRSVVRKFLIYKENDYKHGLFNIRPIYNEF